MFNIAEYAEAIVSENGPSSDMRDEGALECGRLLPLWKADATRHKGFAMSLFIAEFNGQVF
jgi:hypothetical protein